MITPFVFSHSTLALEFVYSETRACTYLHHESWLNRNVESTEGISEIWFCETFPPWEFLRFGVMVRFTYG